MKRTPITKVHAREILDSRGNPTVETRLWSGELSAIAAVPSGVSTGVHEALELRDGDKKRYGGKGVLKACANVNKKIFAKVKGMDASGQEALDRAMLALDKTPNKSRLGANAILSVSLAAARLAALNNGLELYQYLAKLYGYTIKDLPAVLFNVLEGGAHAVSSGLDVQEFFIIPHRTSFAERLRIGAEVYHRLKKNLDAEGYETGLGDEGGFSPRLGSNEAAFKYLQHVIKDAGYKLGRDFTLGTDVAASEFFDAKKQKYILKADKKSYAPSQLYKLYKNWYEKYHLSLIEDGCAEDDMIGWKLLTQALGNKTLLVGDDVFVTDIARIATGIQNHIANTVLIKVNQIGTLTETIAAVKLSQKHNYKILISHRAAETTDAFIADLAVAVNAEYIKTGAPARGERLAKYNRLLEIEEQLS
jgi:enolase